MSLQLLFCAEKDPPFGLVRTIDWANIKKIASGVLALHCPLHIWHIVTKNLSERLHKSRNVIYGINNIKSIPLNNWEFHNQFRRLLIGFSTQRTKTVNSSTFLKTFYSLLSVIMTLIQPTIIKYLNVI